jgi:hypothetical protein
MGGASDEFPLLAVYNLYAANINGDGEIPLTIYLRGSVANGRFFSQVTASSMLYRTRFMVTRMTMTKSGRGLLNTCESVHHITSSSLMFGPVEDYAGIQNERMRGRIRLRLFLSRLRKKKLIVSSRATLGQWNEAARMETTWKFRLSLRHSALM